MKLIIDISEDVYTRLFDNGIQDNEIAVDDVCEMARALRMGTPYEERPQGEWICPNCDLYEQAENNYCYYAGKCTIACHRCKYFKQKGGAE